MMKDRGRFNFKENKVSERKKKKKKILTPENKPKIYDWNHSSQ